MQIIELNVPGLRYSPAPEIDWVREHIGISLPVDPKKVILTEGNRRLLRSHEDPGIKRIDLHLGRSGKYFGTFYPRYWTYFLRSQNDPSNSEAAAIHEVGHGVWFHLRDQNFPQDTAPVTHEDLTPDQLREGNIAGRFAREGFAEVISHATYLRRRFKMDPHDLEIAHLRKIVEMVQLSKKPGAETRRFYDMAHLFMFKATWILRTAKNLTLAEALQRLALNPPATKEEIMDPFIAKYMQSLGVNSDFSALVPRDVLNRLQLS